MNWDLRQQAMLAAMGYTVYRQAAAPGAAPMEVREHARACPPIAHDPSDRLWQALTRAAGGRDPSPAPIPPLDRLRADAAAKRALWPALRALRRQR